MKLPRKPRPTVKFFRIVFTVGDDRYTVTPLAPDPHTGRPGFRLRKETGDRRVYDIRITSHGPRCDCRGFTYRRRCKHIAMLRAARMLNGEGGRHA